MFQRIVDSIFDPVINILLTARNGLDSASSVAARGLNLDYFLGPISLLGWEWRTLVASIISCCFLLLCVMTARRVYGLYLALKEGAKWW